MRVMSYPWSLFTKCFATVRSYVSQIIAQFPTLYGVTLVIIIAYLGGVVLLTNPDKVIENISNSIGWLVALVLAVLHIRATQRDSQIGRREEVKRSLEVEAFRNVTEAVTQFSSTITDITTPYRTLPIALEYYPRDLAISTFNEFRNVKLPQQNISLSNGVSVFVVTIESIEIAIIQFDHLRKFIQFRVDDAQEAISKFQEYARSLDVETLFSKEGLHRLKEECEVVEQALLKITMYLFDYRIELMNCLLADVFEQRVPHRKPLDPDIKILTELATRENVREEEERRDREFVKKSKSLPQ